MVSEHMNNHHPPSISSIQSQRRWFLYSWSFLSLTRSGIYCTCITKTLRSKPWPTIDHSNKKKRQEVGWLFILGFLKVFSGFFAIRGSPSITICDFLKICTSFHEILPKSSIFRIFSWNLVWEIQNLGTLDNLGVYHSLESILAPRAQTITARKGCLAPFLLQTEIQNIAWFAIASQFLLCALVCCALSAVYSSSAVFSGWLNLIPTVESCFYPLNMEKSEILLIKLMGRTIIMGFPISYLP